MDENEPQKKTEIHEKEEAKEREIGLEGTVE
jgi:hypothetical protein